MAVVVEGGGVRGEEEGWVEGGVVVLGGGEGGESRGYVSEACSVSVYRRHRDSESERERVCWY